MTGPDMHISQVSQVSSAARGVGHAQMLYGLQELGDWAAMRSRTFAEKDSLDIPLLQTVILNRIRVRLTPFPTVVSCSVLFTGAPVLTSTSLSSFLWSGLYRTCISNARVQKNACASAVPDLEAGDVHSTVTDEEAGNLLIAVEVIIRYLLRQKPPEVCGYNCNTSVVYHHWPFNVCYACVRACAARCPTTAHA